LLSSMVRGGQRISDDDTVGVHFLLSVKMLNQTLIRLTL